MQRAGSKPRGDIERIHQSACQGSPSVPQISSCETWKVFVKLTPVVSDIVRQLPAAAKMFQAIDKSWKHIMKTTNDDPMALKACCVKDRKETLQSHNAGEREGVTRSLGQQARRGAGFLLSREHLTLAS